MRTLVLRDPDLEDLLGRDALLVPEGARARAPRVGRAPHPRPPPAARALLDERTREHLASKPKIGVVIIHPRVDFHHHYAVPRLVDAGFAVLAANSRHVGNDTMAEHEEMVLDVAACVRWLREKRGVEKVVLLGNSGGGSLVAFYQAEARKAPGDRVACSPGGTPSRFDSAPMTPADAMIYIAAHRGQGRSCSTRSTRPSSTRPTRSPRTRR